MYREMDFSELSPGGGNSVTTDFSEAPSSSISSSSGQPHFNPLRARYRGGVLNTRDNTSDSETSVIVTPLGLSTRPPVRQPIEALVAFLDEEPQAVSGSAQVAELFGAAEFAARLAEALFDGQRRRDACGAAAVELLRGFCSAVLRCRELRGRLSDEDIVGLRRAARHVHRREVPVAASIAVAREVAQWAAQWKRERHDALHFDVQPNSLAYFAPASRAACVGAVTAATLSGMVLSAIHGAFWALLPLCAALTLQLSLLVCRRRLGDGAFFGAHGFAAALLAVAQCVAAVAYHVALAPTHLAVLPLLGALSALAQASADGGDPVGQARLQSTTRLPSPASRTSLPTPSIASAGQEATEQLTIVVAGRAGELLGAAWGALLLLCFLVRVAASSLSTDGNVVALESAILVSAALSGVSVSAVVRALRSSELRLRSCREALMEALEADLSPPMFDSQMTPTAAHHPPSLACDVAGANGETQSGDAQHFASMKLVIGDAPVGAITLAGGNLCAHGELLLEPHGRRGILRTPAQPVHDHVALIAVDLQGYVLMWNASMEAQTNLSARSVHGKPLFALLAPPSSEAEVSALIAAAASDVKVPLVALTLVRNHVSSQTTEMQVVPTPAKTASGETVGVVFIGAATGGLEREVGRAVLTLTALADELQAQAIPAREGVQVLHRVALLLRDALPPSDTISISRVVGCLMTTDFGPTSAVRFDVAADVPESVEINEGKLRALLHNVVGHYAAKTGVAVRISAHSGAADRRTATAGAAAESQREDLLISVHPDDDSVRDSWQPSEAMGAIMAELHARISQRRIAHNGVAIRLIAAGIVQQSAAPSNHSSQVIPSRSSSPHLHSTSTLVTATPTLGSSGHGSSVAAPHDPVRCSVAVHCPDPVASTIIRNVVWSRLHLLYFIDDVSAIPISLDGIDVFFVLLPSHTPRDNHLFGVLSSAIEQRRGLTVVALLASGSVPMPPWTGLGIEFFLPSVVRVPDVHQVLSLAVGRVAEMKGREQKFTEVKKLFAAAKTCPWTRGRLLGRGTSATVYEATNTITEGKMAVRMVPIPQGDAQEMQEMMEGLIAEITLMSQLDHKNIINYLYCERGENTLNIFMEYAAGGSLRSVIDKRGPSSVAQVGLWLQDILEGLDYLHSEGVAHLDVKAANVLLTSQGVCKLADFGTSRRLTRGHARAGAAESAATGTMHFMAPEILTHQQYDTRCDVWSLGCMVIEMLTGRLPFSHLKAGALGVVGYIGSLKPGDAVLLPPNITDSDILSFLRLCLCVEPAKRATCRTLLQHPVVSDAPRHRSSIFTAPAGRVLRKPSQAHIAAKPAVSPTTFSSDDDNERRDSCFSTWSAASSQLRHPSLQPRRAHGDATAQLTPRGGGVREPSIDDAQPDFFM